MPFSKTNTFSEHPWLVPSLPAHSAFLTYPDRLYQVLTEVECVLLNRTNVLPYRTVALAREMTRSDSSWLSMLFRYFLIPTLKKAKLIK